MGLWKGWFDGNRLGWDSPVTDGPINPALVNLAAAGGLGWLDGFDELLARCGLENNGAPFEVKTVKPDGSESHTTFGLHGKIANMPAIYVAVHVGAEPLTKSWSRDTSRSRVCSGRESGWRRESRPLQARNLLVVRDEFVNLKDQPVEMQVLYHWNFGPPFLDEGARFLAPSKSVTPRDARAEQGISQHEVYGGPEPGYAEQVYYHDLHTRPGGERQTLALLRNHAGDKAVVLRFDKDQLPAFTLWKNTGGLRDGYVTGLEPGTNYPNPRPFEKARNRVVTLPVDGRYLVETTLEVLVTSEAVATVEAEIQEIQAQGPARVSQKPREPYAPES